MSVELNHTIVWASDSVAAARFQNRSARSTSASSIWPFRGGGAR